MADQHPHLRCADADRERVVEELREHYAAGRLTLEEFQERSDTAYAAKTFGDLAGITSDLPAAALEPVPRRSAPRISPGVRRAWGSWFTVSLICTVIWLLSVLSGGELVYFWPMWVMGPWGIMLLVGTLGGRGGRGGDQQRQVEGDDRSQRRLEQHRRRSELPHERRHDRHRHDQRHRRNGPHGEVH